MTAEVLSLPRGGNVREPLVPAKAVLKDAPDFRFPISLLDSEWYHSCSREEALAGINLQARAIHQDRAGSLPNSDPQLARLADFGRDVAAWMAAKAKALEGWILCADDRWYHPEVARNVLHIWIGRLEKRRASAFGNMMKAIKEGDASGEDYGFAGIKDDIDEALAALRAIDPQDKRLGDAQKLATKWRKQSIEKGRATVVGMDGTVFPDAEEPIRPPYGQPNRQPPLGGPKVSEAKQSEPLIKMSGRRPDLDLNGSKKEIEDGEAGAAQPEDVGATYPPDAFALFWNPFPLKEKRVVAEAAFRSIQEAGIVTFPVLMDGLRRYIRDKPKSHSWRHAATWLNNRGWTDGQCIPVAPEPGVAAPSPNGIFVPVDSPPGQAWRKEAVHLGKPGWTTVERGSVRGYIRPSLWPPGIDPTDHAPDSGGRR